MDLSDALQALDDHMHKVESKQYGPVEPRLSEIDLSADEILNWLNEYADQVVFSKGSDEYPGNWYIYCEEFDKPASGKTLGQAAKHAVSKWKEINQ